MNTIGSDPVSAVLGIVTVVVLILFGGVLLEHLLARRIVRTEYEWLAVLSHIDWQVSDDLMKGMLERKKSRYRCLLKMVMHPDLNRLEGEGLLEVNVLPSKEQGKSPYIVYRLTMSGFRKKISHLNPSPQDQACA